ncbi:MAG: hypothetical protein P8O79_14450 [Halieaceae bacterium]|nr:hypothetical protein [Halieaceae bacterium]
MEVVKKLVLMIPLITLYGCVSVDMGINVSVFDVVRQTAPKAEVSLTIDLDDAFNCIKRELTEIRLRTDRIKTDSGELLWQVGSPSFLDNSSINAVYFAKSSNQMEIYVTGNMFLMKTQLRELGENCAANPEWSAPNGYWPMGL